MLSSFTVLVATAALANAVSPYIPSGISTGCATFLDTLDTDKALTACTSALISASSAFGPNATASGSSSAPASKSALTSALQSICSTTTNNSTCPPSLITGKLASFYSSCGPELASSPNDQVKNIYDTFYSLVPFLATVCAKDSNGGWCVMNQASADTTSSDQAAPAVAAGSLSVNDLSVPLSSSSSPSRRDATTQYLPNASTISSSNILFLMLTPSLPKAALCTSCTRSVLLAYINFQSSTFYAPGLSQSVLMKGQADLYKGVVSTCGQDFMTSAVQAAGGLGQQSGPLGLGGASAGVSVRASVGVLVASVAAAFMLL